MTMTTNKALTDLADAGVSIWLDDLSRERLESGNLADLIETKGVVGVTRYRQEAAPESATGAGATYRRLKMAKPCTRTPEMVVKSPAITRWLASPSMLNAPQKRSNVGRKDVSRPPSTRLFAVNR